MVSAETTLFLFWPSTISFLSSSNPVIERLKTVALPPNGGTGHRASPIRKTYVYRFTCVIYVLIIFLTAVGCTGRIAGKVANGVVKKVVAQPDPTVQLLEAELRWMEDNLYRLDNQLDCCLEELESARRNNSVLRLELAEARQDGQSDQKKGKGASSPARGNAGGPFDEEQDLDNEAIFDDLAPPKIELGTPADDAPPSAGADSSTPTPASPLQIPADGTGGDGTEPGIKLEGFPDPDATRPPEVDSGAPSDIPPDNPFQGSNKAGPGDVTRILLNKRLTGGYSFDGHEGHEGIMVVVEPQDAFAQYTPLPGRVTVEVTDPSLSGMDRRIGKWHFDATDTQRRMKQTLMGRGIHLQLPWPGAPPQNENLRLTVVYETPDGQQHTAEKQLRVVPTTEALAAKADRAEQEWSPYRPQQGQRTANAANQLDWQFQR